jgi:hypothetical protein
MRPESTSIPHQNNPLIKVSMASVAQDATFRAMEICTGIAPRVESARVKLPLLFNILPFQAGCA